MTKSSPAANCGQALSHSSNTQPVLARDSKCIRIVVRFKIILIFQQMAFWSFPLPRDEIFQLPNFLAPTHSIKEFAPAELGLIERAFAVTGSQIKKSNPLLRERLHDGGHDVEPQVSIEHRQIVKGVIIKRQPTRL